MLILLHLLKFEKSTLCACEICPIYSLSLPPSKNYKKGMSSDNDSVPSSNSGSGSGQSRGEGRGRSRGDGSGQLASEGRIPMDVTVETREDLTEEIAESSLLARAEYGLVFEDVRTQYSLFKWSCLLTSSLNCILVIQRGIRRDIMSLERVNAID